MADFSNNAVAKVDPQGHITVLAQSPDGDGIDGGLGQPGEPIFWNGKLVLTCFDMVSAPTKSTQSTTSRRRWPGCLALARIDSLGRQPTT